jgi:hypothetical protein
MTVPLNTMLKVGESVSISVDNEYRHIYFPSYLHRQSGKIWEIDNEHIWVMGTVQLKDGQLVPSGPHRYPWSDITVSFIQ